jgi:hypothetical protein
MLYNTQLRCHLQFKQELEQLYVRHKKCRNCRNVTVVTLSRAKYSQEALSFLKPATENGRNQREKIGYQVMRSYV